MQIETFKILADLVETTSFSEAAERNGMTQSAVSQHIKVLEERFGVVLVERGPKNFSVTPEGEIFLKAGEEILQIYLRIWNELELLKNATSGRLRISTVFSIGFYELPPFLDEFKEVYSAVKLEIKYRQDKDVYADVMDNKADLGLVAYPQPCRGIEIESAWCDQLVVICSSDHKFALEESIEVESLGGERFISFYPDPPMREAIENLLLEANVSVDQLMVFDNIETVKRAVAIEGAVSIVPWENVRFEVESGTLHKVDLNDALVNRPVGILRRSNKALSRTLEAMIALLQT